MQSLIKNANTLLGIQSRFLFVLSKDVSVLCTTREKVSLFRCYYLKIIHDKCDLFLDQKSFASDKMENLNNKHIGVISRLHY